jgi:hypothetical protein
MFEKIKRSRGFTHCLVVSPDALPLLRVTRHHYFQPAGVAGWDRHGPRYQGTRALNFMPRYQEFSRDQDLLKTPDLRNEYSRNRCHITEMKTCSEYTAS